MVFWLALQGVLGLLLISLVGYVLAAKGWFDAHAIITMPRLITCVALPPYLFYTVSHSFQRDQLLHMIYGSLIPFVSMLLTFALAYLLARLFRVKEARRGLFCTGMSASNTMYIGLPVNLALFGDEALPFVLLYFFANTVFFWTVGNYSISHDKEELRAKASLLTNARHIFSPPMIGMLCGAALVLFSIRLPGFVESFARYLGNMTTPLALIFIGTTLYQMDLRHLHIDKDLVLGVMGKLVLAPLLLAVMLYFLPDVPDLMRKVFIIQAGLPSILQTALMSAYYDTDPQYGALMVTMTTVLSILTIPLTMTLVSL
ncbi:MAG TPA: AEC family transporter [Candidatus Desulfovibrio intestinigallinarum]|nr:AEC family transporter [Candidatus Desulfovibrio intestinigallinarum]